jgi:ABC-type lipoprotein export system ATPase subunit
MSAVIATHNYELSQLMDRQIALKKGKIVEV